MVINGATTKEVFRAFVKEILLPTLTPGDIVIMDNLAAHKDDDALVCIQGVGALALFLPPYSPDLNPIEKMWSKVKEFLRSAEARTQGALDAAIASAMKTVSGSDAVGWFKSCGYNII